MNKILQDCFLRIGNNSRHGLVLMKGQITEQLLDLSDRAKLRDDPERIAGYRAVGLAEGLMTGSEEDVLWAWQWLGDHPQFTSRLQEWFAYRVAELREMGRIR